MNNKDALELFHLCKSNARDAALQIIEDMNIPEESFQTIRYKFSQLKDTRREFVKRSDVGTWEDLLFIDLTNFFNIKKIKSQSSSKELMDENIRNATESRKPIASLELKELRKRLKSLLSMIKTLAEEESVDSVTIATYALQLLSNEVHDTSRATICKELISKGTFGYKPTEMSIDRSLLLLDILEIGKRKYTEFRHLCKLENIHFPAYSKIAKNRNNVVLSDDINYVRNDKNVIIGVSISYSKILEHTISRILQTLPSINDINYPFYVKIADGLDGSGCHKIYNQIHDSKNFTKNFILFAFRIISIVDSNKIKIWCKDNPNATSGIRPVALIAQKENECNIKFIMDKLINPEVNMIEQGFSYKNGIVNVQVLRTMFDEKCLEYFVEQEGHRANFAQQHTLNLKT